MAYELTIQTADNVTSTELSNSFDSNVDTSKLILSERESTFSKQESLINKSAHIYARYYISDRFDPAPVLSSVESVVTNADWAQIEGRHVWTEYSDDSYLNDETYYPYEMQNGFRAPPVIEYIRGFEGNVTEAHFMINGNEFSVTDEKISLARPTEYIRQDAIVAELDGSISVIEGAEYPNPKNNNIEWPKRPEIPSDVKVGAYVTVKSILDRIPRSGIEIVDVVGNDEERTVDYSHGTVPDDV